MKLGKFKITNRGLYWGLVITFALLYLCVGFVSTLHSITFFHLANSMSLAVLLGLTYEVGQASVLFSILMSEKNKGKYLPWALMFLLTALQVTANVYASFKYMVQSGTNDWPFWQKSILFGVQSSNPEVYQVIISWISGALLPIVALGMTALVAQNMKFMNEENEEHPEKPIDEVEKKVEEVLNYDFGPDNNDVKKEEVPVIVPVVAPDREEQLETLKEVLLSNVGKGSEVEIKFPISQENGLEVIQKPIQINLRSEEEANKEFAETLNIETKNIEVNPRAEMSEIGPGEKAFYEQKASELASEIDKEIFHDILHKETDIKNTTTDEDATDDMDEEVAGLTPDIKHPLGKYDIKFGPEFSKTMDEIHDEFAAEQAIQEINDSIDKQESLIPDVIDNVEIVPPEEVTKIIPEKRKRGRPPQKDIVSESKKEKELLPKEDVKVPQKSKRNVHPLKLKEKKIKPLKNLKEINKPSKGDEVIALLEKIDKKKQKESITTVNTVPENPQDSILVPPELKDDYASVILDGVEVIDAKAVPKKNLN